MTDHFLHSLVSLISQEPPHGSTSRLLAFVRIRCALYGPAIEFGADELCGDGKGADALFDALSRRAERTADRAERSRIVRGMFRLTCGTALVPDPLRMEACCAATEELLAQEQGTEPTPALCDCLADLLYPDPATDDEYADRLFGRMDRWATALGRDGRWPSVSYGEALERIATMNRVCEMFGCERTDPAVRRAFAAYRKVALHATDTESLGVLAGLYVQGNALPVDRKAAGEVFAELDGRLQRLVERSDAWWVCMSHLAGYGAQETSRRLQREYLDKIA